MKKALALLMALSPAVCLANTETAGSWINIDNGLLQSSLQTTIDALRAQTRQIFINRDTNYQQDLDIQTNLDLINSLDRQVNERITQVTSTIDNQFTTLEDTIDSGFDDMDNQFTQLDDELNQEFADIGSQFVNNNEELDRHYQILVALNNETRTLNGVDVISGQTSASGSLSDQIADLQSDLTAGEAMIANHESRLNAGASAIASLQSLVNSKASLSDVRNNVRVGTSTTTGSCIRWRFSYEQGGQDNEEHRTAETTTYGSWSNYRNWKSVSCIDWGQNTSAWLY